MTTSRTIGLHRLSEPYSAAGSAVASSLTRAVRDSSLHEWAILVRETLQNSIDARISSNAVTYSVDIYRATLKQKGVLQKHVFRDIPAELPELARSLKSANLPLLVIADWNTQGLGGPTRADLATEEKANFCDFFLNVGREESKGYQGGTRGLGRGVLFDISSASSIVVFTRTTVGGRKVSRLLAMAVSPGFNDGKRKFTGRHWWCASASNPWPEPLEGPRAEELAHALGLDVMPVKTTGTAIMVIGPRIPDDYTLDDVCDEMIQAALLWGWPLLIGRDGTPEVELAFSTGDGNAWQPVGPEDPGSPVREFARAYREALAGSPRKTTRWQTATVAFGAGRKKPEPLGTLTFRHLPNAEAPQTPSAEEAIPLASIALMREPRLVVKYLPVPPHPVGTATVGVFVADARFDRTFAETEPVAHDDWLPQKLGLRANERNPVKQTIEKIRRIVRESHLASGTDAPSGHDADRVAPVVGDYLGGMLAGTDGFGGQPRPTSKQPSPTPGRSSRAVVGPPTLRAEGDHTIAAFPVSVIPAQGRPLVRLAATSKVLLDSGVEDDSKRPEGAPSPYVIGWEGSGGFSPEPTLEVMASDTELTVLVEQPHDTAITVEVTVEAFP
jgi:hypothetical protein